MNEATVWFTAGALVRGEVRRVLDRLEAPFVERKGLLDSQFTVKTTAAKAILIKDWVETPR